MLALDDERWNLLNHAYGKANDIPEMILELKRLSKIDLEENDLLYGYLCHQNTTYSATYAAIPHIAEIAFQENQSIENQTEIVIFCGSVHALRDYDKCFHIKSDDESLVKELILQIEESYLTAIEKIKPLAEKLLAEKLLENSNLENSYQFYVFYMFLAFEGFEDLSKVFILSNYKEFNFKCPNCKSYLCICQQDTKMVAYKEDYARMSSAKHFDLIPAKVDLQNLKGDLPSKQQVAEWVLFYAEKYDVKPVKYQIPYLFGKMICPNCDKKISIIDALSQELFGSNYESF